jgi:methionyl-tRNA formyltransferase
MGRRKQLIPSPIKQLALNLGLKVFYSPQDIAEIACDFYVVASYGRILSVSTLALPRVASVNVHPSLLPKYRGPSPVPAALLAGDRVTGVCVIQMTPKVDAGPIYSLSEVAIAETDDAVSLLEKLFSIGAELLAQTLPGIFEGDIEPQVQDEFKASYSPKMDRESGCIEWLKEDALTLERKGKAYRPWPGLYTTFQEKRLKVLSGFVSEDVFVLESALPGQVVRVGPHIGVGTTKGVFLLKEVQWEGKSPCAIEDFVRGHPEFMQAVLPC